MAQIYSYPLRKLFIMRNTAALLSILFFIFSCNNSKEKQDKAVTQDSIPACVMQKIEAINKKTISNPPLQIDEYLYNGKRVFLYTADCCDQFNMLYDENCKSLCAPSGGLDGSGDRKCRDFSANAKHIKVTWKNENK
jgi:hypothetical protein